MLVFNPNSYITPCAILLIRLSSKMALVIYSSRQYYQMMESVKLIMIHLPVRFSLNTHSNMQRRR